MVSTRGKDNEGTESKTGLPHRECRRSRMTLQEPEDEMFWESDDNPEEVACHKSKRKARRIVSFEGKNSSISEKTSSKTLRNRTFAVILSQSLCESRPRSRRTNSWNSQRTSCFSCNDKPRSSKRSTDFQSKSNKSTAKISNRLINNQSDEMVAIEGDTDTDDEIFQKRKPLRSKQPLRNSRIDRRSNSCSPIKKEFVINVHADMSDKSDNEAGLRRSSRHRGSKSWLLGEKKLRGYPNMVHSSEPENEEHRPSRKQKYVRTSSNKSTSSPPHTRSLRYRTRPNSSNLRNRDFLHSSSKRSLHQRSRRLPVRYRDNTDDDEEEEEDDDDDDDDDGDEEGEEEEDNNKDGEDELDDKKEEKEDSNDSEAEDEKEEDVDETKESGALNSGDETENYNDYKKAMNSRSKRARRQASLHLNNRRRSYRTRNVGIDTSESDDAGKQEEETEEQDTSNGNNTKKSQPERRPKSRFQSNEVGRLALDNYDTSYERSKRQRKPVSRLTYENFNSQSIKVSSSDEDEEDEVVDSQERGRRYSLREKKTPLPAVNHRHRKHTQFLSSPARKPVFNQHRKRVINGSSSSSSDDNNQFEEKKSKSMAKARNRCLPMNLTADDIVNGNVRDRAKIGGSLADIDPMSLDSSVSFECVGGLALHIKALKEMIIFPLMYPEVFQKFNTAPPRGVLFYGQPGTGKTLVARALANECSQNDKKVAFFMRKGADCLSKWVGESERQLRLLFDQAYQMRPSIIFFDEIDGLAPVRSSRQDQIHSSIVSTLLALMDGLDSRGEVVVIGATNRVDAIDPALRRPGRFDREFNFPLPSVKARRQILNIHMSKWSPPPSKRLLNLLADHTVSYCGADLKALCAEATLNALRSKYPQIYSSKHKLQLDVSKILVRFVHFRQALNKIVPAGQRAVSSPGRKLNREILPLMQPVLKDVLNKLKRCFARGFSKVSVEVHLHRPRILITGSKGQAHTTHLAPAVLHALENVPSHKLDMPTLFSVSARAPEEACAQVFHEAKRNMPSIIYIPLIDKWWATVSETVRATFLSLLNEIEPSSSLLLLVTSESPHSRLDEEVQELFSMYRDEIYVMRDPLEEERRSFFKPLFYTKIPRKPKVVGKKRVIEELPLAPAIEPRKFSSEELHKIEMREEASLRELRIFLRQICAKLAKNRMFYIFTKPVDLDEVPDYTDVITEPMDLETMMTKIDRHQYECAEDFLKDIDLICANALEYNPDRNPEDKIIRHRACTLRDTAYAYIKAEMDTDFEDKCQDIRKVRKKRKQPSVSCPAFIKVGQPVTKLATEVAERRSNNNHNSTMELDKSCDNKINILDSSRKRKRKKKSSWARGMVSIKKRKVDKEEDKVKESSKSNEDEKTKETTGEDDEEEKTTETTGEDEEEKTKGTTGEDEESNEEFPNGDMEGESSIDSSGRIDDELDNNETLKKEKVIVESSLHLCNGNLSTEDSHDSMKVTSAADLLYKNSLKEAIREEVVESKDSVTVAVNAEEPVVSSSEPGCFDEKKVIIDWSHLEAVFESCVSATHESAVEELQHLYSVIAEISRKHSSSLDRSQLLINVESEIRRFAQFRNKL